MSKPHDKAQEGPAHDQECATRGQAKVLQKAPDFDADAYVKGDFKKVRLADYKGKWAVMVFYPLDFTFVCPTELRAFAKDQAAFDKLNAAIIAVSTDSKFSHKAWFERDLPEVKFPVIADFTKQISAAYGVLNESTGFALRGTFVIDPDGMLQYASIGSPKLGRSTDETLRVLSALQTGELCPANWKPGDKTLGK